MPTQPVLVCPGHTKDGDFFISASHDKLPMLRNARTGDWIGTFEGHNGAVWTAKLNNLATYAVTGSGDFSAILWNAVTGEKIFTFPHKSVVRTVEFSPDSRFFATGGYEGIIRIFDVERPSANPAQLSLADSKEKIKKLLWSLDSYSLFVGTMNGRLLKCDISRGQIVFEMSLPVEDPERAGVQDMELCRDGIHMLIAAGKSVILFNMRESRIVRNYNLGFSVESASLCPSKPVFVAAGEKLDIGLYELESGKLLQEFKSHHGRVHSLRWTRSGDVFFSGADDASVIMWRP